MAMVVSEAPESFRIVFVTGPSQVGKTSVFEHCCAGAARRYVSTDDPAARALTKSDPELFLKTFPPLLHFTYDSWRAYLGKFEKYTRPAAEKAFVEGKRARFFHDIVLRPAFAFFKMFVLQGRFLDGKIGWVLSVNHFFYTEMKYVRLYFLQREREKEAHGA